MASTLFNTTLNVHYTIPNPSDPTSPISFTSPRKLPLKKFTIYCNSPASPPNVTDPHKKNPSLSDQLKPLSTTTLIDTPKKDQTPNTQPLKKPKSTWVNPTRPKPSVLTLQRQKRSSHSFNPQITDLRLFARKLNDSDNSESAFLAVLDEIPHSPTRDNALLLLNSLKQWQKTIAYFNWVKTQNLFPLETIFYNVTMKSLRFGRQFQLIEELAYDMIENGVDLDNITYSTIITCAKRCNLFDKAVEWFERMYKTGLMPDEVTYSAVLDVYAKLGKLEQVMSLYERGRASGWTPDPIAFAVLAKMYGEAGDYDGIRFVLQEMKSAGVQPNLVVYNTLFQAMGRVGKPHLARSLFEEMVDSGIEPNEKTLTALVKIYGKARWGRDALQLCDRMRSNRWPMDFFLYNTLLSMCADLGMEEEAEILFEDMKESKNSRPDSWSYTAMLNIYSSGAKVDKAMDMFNEMSELGVAINVMGCTCLIQCLGRAKRINDLVRVFEVSMERGVRPDDRLCGCLLSVVSYCEGEDCEKVLSCLQLANPKLVTFVKLLGQEESSLETIKEEFKNILNETAVEARRPFCNCLIDICRNRDLRERAHELLYVGTMYGLYQGLHTKTADEWHLNVRSLSVGAAHTAFEEWMGTLTKLIKRQEALPPLFSADTGAGTHKFSQGLASAFDVHLRMLNVPFTQNKKRPGIFVATREELVSWAESKTASVGVMA